MNIYFSLKSQERTDESGRLLQATEKIILCYGRQEWIHLNIRDLEELPDEVLCWDVIVSSLDSILLCHTVDERIDSGDFAQGHLAFPVFTRTENFLSAVKEHDVHGWLEVRGFNANGDMCYCMRFRILAQYSSDLSEDAPAEVIDDIATMSWVKKFMTGGSEESFVTKETFEKTISGMSISSVESSLIPLVHNAIIKHTLAAEEELSFDVSALSSETSVTMELWLTMPETVVSFTISGVTWVEEPAFDTANMLYVVTVRWDGEKVIANTAYTMEVS